MNNFLMCGLGSVGQRHFRNLKELLPDCNIDVYCSKRKSYRIFDNDLNIRYNSNLFKEYDINNLYHNLDDLKQNYDTVIICSLPPERIDIAIEFAKKDTNLFIEKPLSNNMDKVLELEKIINSKNLFCAIGFQMRFHPILKQVKKLIKSNFFGSLYYIDVIHSNSMKNWTKGRNLKDDFYALNYKEGGGVAISQCHEIDYINWLFDAKLKVEAVNGACVKYPVEDTVTMLGSLKDNISVNIHLDFLSPKPIRTLRILGTKNSIQVDILRGEIYYRDKGSLENFSIPDWNYLFLTEMDAFLRTLKKKKWQEPLADIYAGIESLETIDRIKKLSI